MLYTNSLRELISGANKFYIAYIFSLSYVSLCHMIIKQMMHLGSQGTCCVSISIWRLASGHRLYSFCTEYSLICSQLIVLISTLHYTFGEQSCMPIHPILHEEWCIADCQYTKKLLF